MSKSAKTWLTAAACLVFTGLIIFGVAMTMTGWNLKKLSTSKFETNTYNIAESFKNISIVTDTADIVFIPSDNSSTSVVCYEQINEKHSALVENGTLTIKLSDTRKWYEYIGINFASPKIAVYLPKGEYGLLNIKESTGAVEIPSNFKFESIDISATTGAVKNLAEASGDIKIKTSTGAIEVEGISAASLELSVSTGMVSASDITCRGDVSVKASTGRAELVDITCQNLISTGNTGKIYLDNVIASEKFNIKRSTGDVKFDGCDAAEIFVETDTGDVKGTLLSSKVFITRTDTGNVTVPKTVSGGKCEITTDTGDIKISVE